MVESYTTTNGQSNFEDLKGQVNYEYLVKLKMVGDSSVGKSSIVLRFCEDNFSDNMAPTIGNQ